MKMEPIDILLILNSLFSLATRITDYYDPPAATSEEEVARFLALRARVAALHEEVMAYQPLPPLS